MALAVTVTLLYIVYLCVEKWMNDRCRASFQHVIHVNGIRGKTSICRLIDANLRHAGYKVFTKTTGSAASYIDVDGVEHSIRRLGPARIDEQIGIMRKAYKQNAEILIVECMAIRPEMQEISQKQIIKGDMCVISNVRYDHILNMGMTLDEIADALSAVVPNNGVLFSADANYQKKWQDLCEKNQSKFVHCDECGLSENQSIAYEVGRYLGIDKSSFIKSLPDVKKDFGTEEIYQLENGMRLINLFSVNDPMSTFMRMKELNINPEKVTFVYNHRADRQDRLLLFALHFFNKIDCYKIYACGQSAIFVERYLKKRGINCERVKHIEDAFNEENQCYVGIGNIKGEAERFIRQMAQS